MAHSPAFQFYPAEFLVDSKVALMSNQEVGCYIKLICYCWREGTLPNEVKKLAKLCGETVECMEHLWPALQGCFEAVAGNESHLIHPRLEQERQKQLDYRHKRAAAGKVGAQAKWGETEATALTRSERLTQARTKATHTSQEWQALVTLCSSHCVRCGATARELVKDHIHPIYQGGSDGIENLQPLCRSCSSSKGQDTRDYRPHDWSERLAKCLANAAQMPEFLSSSSSLSSSLENTKNNKQHSLPEANVPVKKINRSPHSEAMVKIFEYWKSLLGHPQAKLDNKRAVLIRTALKLGYSEEELCQAIQGCARTPYNLGENERGQRYDGLHVILRNADQIDRFIRNCHSPPSARVSTLQTLNLHLGRRLIDEHFEEKTYEQTPIEHITWFKQE